MSRDINIQKTVFYIQILQAEGKNATGRSNTTWNLPKSGIRTSIRKLDLGNFKTGKMSHHKIYFPNVKFANSAAIIGLSKIKSMNKAKKCAKKTEGIISFYEKNVKTGKILSHKIFDLNRIHAYATKIVQAKTCTQKNRVIKSLHRYTGGANFAKELLSILPTKNMQDFYMQEKLK